MKVNSKILLAGAITSATFLGAAGGTMLSSLSASADTTATPAATTTASTVDTANGTPPAGVAQRDPSQGGHMANGKTETLLTGDNATKAKAAALAAVPGGTVQRVETDADGDAYEAHMLKPDGTPVTIKFDANFKVTGTDSR